MGDASPTAQMGRKAHLSLPAPRNRALPHISLSFFLSLGLLSAQDLGLDPAGPCVENQERLNMILARAILYVTSSVVAKCGTNLNPNGRYGDLLRVSMVARKTEDQHLKRQPY